MASGGAGLIALVAGIIALLGFIGSFFITNSHGTTEVEEPAAAR